MVSAAAIAIAAMLSLPGDAALDDTLQAERFLFGGDIILSAAKHEEPLGKSPSAITVISSHDLKNYGSLVEALRAVPGLDLAATTPSDTVVNIRQNAMGSNFPVLILVDGRKTSLDILGYSILETLPVALDDIERIEVIRGPGSALYGAALAGIIQIFTKDPRKTQGALVHLAAGEFNSREAVARWGGTLGASTAYRLTAAFNTTDSREGALLSKKTIGGTAALSTEMSPSSRLDLQAGFDRTAAGVITVLGPISYEPLQPFASVHYAAVTDTYEAHAQAAYARVDIPLTIPFLESLKHTLGPFIGGPFTGLDYLHVPTVMNIYDLEVYGSPFKNIARNRLTIGAEGRYSDAMTAIMGYRYMRESIAAVYLQDEYTPVDMVTVLGGIRYDHNSVSPPSWSPRVSVVLGPAGGHSLRVSGGVSFRKPSFYENQFSIMGLSDSTALGARFPISNPDLKNQRNTTLEAGYQWAHRSARLFLDTFYTTMKDRFIFTSANNTYQYRNDPSSYHLYGGEAGADWTIRPDLARVTASYSVFSGNDIGGVEPPAGGTRSKAMIGGDFHLPWHLTASVQAHYIDGRTITITDPSIAGLLRPPRNYTVPSYTLINGRLACTLPSPRIEFGVQAFNMMDARAYDYPFLSNSTVGMYGGERLSRTVLGFVRGEF